ncbi:hypothetical protein CROQUDRAFT_133248 [Cronartium quercuum f. sp. fusiforme G11]|uniref:Uncharacterized protein n=1 Tax=Cronartium quercuum f. sp. fusiforme G11 TaxID=708437 RepID=A0A9P6TC46_9BASI|nr:hypothetical protein CROQUDRAFT_133248 [Cronartium quercuum f. sp. fusiforme G11]
MGFNLNRGRCEFIKAVGSETADGFVPPQRPQAFGNKFGPEFGWKTLVDDCEESDDEENQMTDSPSKVHYASNPPTFPVRRKKVLFPASVASDASHFQSNSSPGYTLSKVVIEPELEPYDENQLDSTSDPLDIGEIEEGQQKAFIDTPWTIAHRVATIKRGRAGSDKATIEEPVASIKQTDKFERPAVQETKDIQLRNTSPVSNRGKRAKINQGGNLKGHTPQLHPSVSTLSTTFAKISRSDPNSGLSDQEPHRNRWGVGCNKKDAIGAQSEDFERGSGSSENGTQFTHDQLTTTSGSAAGSDLNSIYDGPRSERFHHQHVRFNDAEQSEDRWNADLGLLIPNDHNYTSYDEVEAISDDSSSTSQPPQTNTSLERSRSRSQPTDSVRGGKEYDPQYEDFHSSDLPRKEFCYAQRSDQKTVESNSTAEPTSYHHRHSTKALYITKNDYSKNAPSSLTRRTGSHSRRAVTSKSELDSIQDQVPVTLRPSSLTSRPSRLRPISPHPAVSALYMPSSTFREFKAGKGPVATELEVPVMKSRAMRLQSRRLSNGAKRRRRNAQHAKDQEVPQASELVPKPASFERCTLTTASRAPKTKHAPLFSKVDRGVDCVVADHGLDSLSLNRYGRMREMLEMEMAGCHEWPSADQIADSIMRLLST